MARQCQPHARGSPNLPKGPGIIPRTDELIRGMCVTGAYFERLEDDPEPLRRGERGSPASLDVTNAPPAPSSRRGERRSGKASSGPQAIDASSRRCVTPRSPAAPGVTVLATVTMLPALLSLFGR